MNVRELVLVFLCCFCEVFFLSDFLNLKRTYDEILVVLSLLTSLLLLFVGGIFLLN